MLQDSPIPQHHQNAQEGWALGPNLRVPRTVLGRVQRLSSCSEAETGQGQLSPGQDTPPPPIVLWSLVTQIPVKHGGSIASRGGLSQVSLRMRFLGVPLRKDKAYPPPRGSVVPHNQDVRASRHCHTRTRVVRSRPLPSQTPPEPRLPGADPSPTLPPVLTGAPRRGSPAKSVLSDKGDSWWAAQAQGGRVTWVLCRPSECGALTGRGKGHVTRMEKGTSLQVDKAQLTWDKGEG